jgi:dTDP-4-amino-4,6-dideoxygalactose transaminase
MITTPFSFIATTSSMVWEGLTPVFADIDAESFNMDPYEIERCITKDTSAIVPVHVFGNACDVETIEKIAARHGLKVIYDAAHAFSIDYKGESVLNHGDISILSFHATKLFHTIEGGALVIKDDTLYKRAQAMINFGIDTQSGNSEAKLLGINAKMNEFEAAMGLCILDDMDHIVAKRKKAVAYYEKYFKGKVGLQKHDIRASRNYSYFPIVFESEETLLTVMDKLHEKNIFPRRYFFPSLETLSYLGYQKPQVVSDSISRRILCLPLYPGLEEAIQQKIVEIVLDSIA